MPGIMSAGRNRVPSFQLASGTTNERDNSYNLTTIGNIFYNTDTSNVEVYHEDPSNNAGWRDLVMNNKEQIDISGDLYVGGGDIYGNGQLDFYTATNAANSIGWFELRQDKTIMGGDNIQFRTGSTTSVPGTERMRILSNGNVGINDTAPTGGKLCVNGTTYLNGAAGAGLRITRNTYDTPGSREWLISNHITSGTGTSHLFFRIVEGDTIATDNINFGGGGQIICSGTVTANGVILSSDDRIKENEKLIVNATETLSKLTPQIYDKYHNMDLSGSFQVESGLIAQEVYYNAPELRHLVHLGQDTDASGNEYTPTPEEMDLSGVDIANDPDYGSHGWSKTEKSGLNYSGLIAYLIKSNEELVERIEILKTENTEQKGQIIQLTTDISMIRNHIGI